MPSANLDLVRSIYAAWERGDFSSTLSAHPEIEFVRADAPDDRGPSAGVAGMAESFRRFLSAWEEYRAEADEIREVDDERVLLLVNQTGRGKTSGVELWEKRTRGGYPAYLPAARA